MYVVLSCSTSVKEAVKVQGFVKNVWLLKLQNKIPDKKFKSPVNTGFFLFAKVAKCPKVRKGFEFLCGLCAPLRPLRPTFHLS